jgi:protein-S-isoprenylcysteine O-methyltransferase Ste14
MRFLELKVPPLVVTLLAAGSGWYAARMVPTSGFVLPYGDVLAGSFFLAGIGVAASGAGEFRRARTTLNPLIPEKSSALVVSGVYRWTRNPIYLGMLLTLLCWATYLANWVSFAFLPVFVIYMNHFQIAPEERALASRFGQEFAAYRSKVRRWI